MELNEIMELFEKHEAQEYARGFEVGKGYGYKKGYDAGLDKIQERVDDAYGVGYRHGHDDAIDTVKWLFRNVPDKELFEGNYVEDILNLYPWEYIRAKIKEYEEKQTEYKIKAEYDEETRSYSYMVDSSSEKPNRSAHKIRKDGVKVPICSNCYMRLDERWNYCPHCGSKLDEGEEE